MEQANNLEAGEPEVGFALPPSINTLGLDQAKTQAALILLRNLMKQTMSSDKIALACHASMSQAESIGLDREEFTQNLMFLVSEWDKVASTNPMRCLFQ